MNILIHRYILILAFFAMAAITAFAQEIIMPEGTVISLTLTKDISSKFAERGDEIGFSVAKDVVVEDKVIIKQGTDAKGSVIYAEKGGYMGHSGKLAIQVVSTTTVDGEPIKLRAAKGGEGDSAAGSTITLTLLFGPFGILKKGGDTTVKQGSELTVYTAEERRFRIDGVAVVTIPSAAPSAAAGEKVTVYIYRPNKMVGRALEPSVFCDGVELGRMDNGRYFVLNLSPGKHIIHLTNDKKGYEIDMGAGQTYYFRVGIEMGMWKGNGKILLESNEKGAEEVKKIKPIGADKVKDKTMVVQVFEK
jgi:hypothetical protein